MSAKDIVLFQEARQSYRGHLVICASLQCILTLLGLPLNQFQSWDVGWNEPSIGRQMQNLVP